MNLTVTYFLISKTNSEASKLLTASAILFEKYDTFHQVKQRPDDAMMLMDDCNKPQHHYADGVTADGFLSLLAAKKPSLLKTEVRD